MAPKLDPREIYTLTFDCYGMLIDWRTGVARAAAAIEALRGCDLDRLVRDREHSERELQRGPYRPYGEIVAQSVTLAAREQGRELDAASAHAFAQSVATWPPFEESTRVLRRLAARYQLAILSNIETHVLEASVRLLDAPFEALITAEELRSYKPAPAHFEAAPARLGVERERILHVACSMYHDVRPATALGFHVAWINREHEEPALDVRPWRTFDDLTALAAALGC